MQRGGVVAPNAICGVDASARILLRVADVNCIAAGDPAITAIGIADDPIGSDISQYVSCC